LLLRLRLQRGGADHHRQVRRPRRGLAAGPAARVAIDTGGLATGGAAGDSIAVASVPDGDQRADGHFEAELSGETLARTTLGRLAAGSAVNLEPALRASDVLGGHLVTGHVDGVARVRDCREEHGVLTATIDAPDPLARFIAAKGSVALDGVSLTVGRVTGAAFVIDLVPHTRAATTLGALGPGSELNFEVDLVARYLDRLIETRRGA
jgi:riboflavin synthase